MLKTVMIRSAVIAAACALSLSAYAMADSAKHPIDIPSGDLGAALDLLARQTRVDIVYRPEQARGLRTRGVKGELSTTDAAARLLEGTPLILSTDASGAIMVAAPLHRDERTTSANQTSPPPKAQGSFWDRFHLAQATQTIPAGAESVASGADDRKSESVEEVIVTGTRTSGMAVMDSPAPVQLSERRGPEGGLGQRRFDVGARADRPFSHHAGVRVRHGGANAACQATRFEPQPRARVDRTASAAIRPPISRSTAARPTRAGPVST